VLESAAISAFVKCAYLPLLASGDFPCKFCLLATNQAIILTCSLVEGANLVIWGVAETAVTIMAASIPVMRVLFRDVASTYRSRKSGPGSKYGLGGSTLGGKSNLSSKGSVFSRNQNNTVITSNALPTPPKGGKCPSEDEIELSPRSQYDQDKIVQTSEISIKWHKHDDEYGV
jgi:hypothetical protein